MYQYYTLANGIRIVFRRSLSDVAYSGVYINVGSRDEEPSQYGMAHFIEHSIFKGTTHRRAYQILNRIDGVGGELNAFTTKEETCIYASSLTEHLERCLELFSDVLFNSTFPEGELSNEKEVIIEEINSYQDTPSELIYDEFEELIFEGHPLAHNILGTKRNVRRFTPDEVRRFMSEHYTTDRMVISVVANVPFERVVRLCERHFGCYQAMSTTYARGERPEVRHFDKTVHRRTHQTHMLLGCAAPTIYDEDKVAFTLLNNMLGGPAMNSRLNVAIRERYGFCYTIESQYVPLSDAGIFYIYAGLESASLQRARDLIVRELMRLIDTALGERQLSQAKRQLVGQMTIGNDVAMNEMQSIGKAYLSFSKVDTVEEMAADIMSLSAVDVQAVAQRYLQPEQMSLLAYC